MNINILSRRSLGDYALITRCQPAVIILDRWWRSGTDGWEYLKHLWAEPQTTDIGVILTAGQTGIPVLQAEVLRTMRCQIVQTPLDRDEVLRAIATLLAPSSVAHAPERRVNTVAVIPAVPAQAPALLLEVASHPYVVEREPEELLRLTVAARATRQRSSALDAASDS